MAKKPRNTHKLPTDDQGRLIDPFTGAPLIPVEQLQEAVRQIPEGMSEEEADRILHERIEREDIRFADAVRETGKDGSFLSRVIANIKPEECYLLDGSLPTGKHDEKTVLGSEIVFKHPIHTRGIYISKELLQRIKKLPEKTGDDLLLTTDVPRALKIAPNNSMYRAWLKDIEAKLRAGEVIEIGGYPIQKLQASNAQPYCIHRDTLPALAKELGIQITGELPEKTEDDLTLAKDLPKALKRDAKNQKYATWRTEVEAKLAAGESVKVGGYPIRQMSAGAIKPYCLHRDTLPILAQELGIKLVGELPKKTEDDLTLTKDVPAALKIGLNNEKYIAWRTEVEAKLAAGETVELAGYPVLEMNAGRIKPYCLHRDAIPALANELGIAITALPEKTEDDLTLAKDIPIALKTGYSNPKYAAWRTEVEAKLAAGETVEVDGYPVRQMYAGRSNRPHCLHRDAIPALAKKLGVELPDKTEDDLVFSELPPALKIHSTNPKYAAWRAKVEAKLATGETVKVGEYPIQQMNAGTRSPYCLHRNALPALAKELGIQIIGELPEKTENDLTISRDVPAVLKTANNNPKYIAWRTRIEAQLAAGETVEVGGYPVRQMKSGTKHSYCLHGDAIPTLKEELGLPDTPKHTLEKKLQAQKASPAGKIGDVDESKMPENLRGQLGRKHKKQSEK